MHYSSEKQTGIKKQCKNDTLKRRTLFESFWIKEWHESCYLSEDIIEAKMALFLIKCHSSDEYFVFNESEEN